ncbi:uncharacterized protein [Cebidichthys violaceus]|uniref:uncharacterized protein isoform X2 n=1 Tax=Cebidichthys violaceus TaxID=271503 RepID=UPI0035C95A1B
MVEVRWIKMTLFVTLLLLLQFTVTGQTSSSFIVRAGDEVTLPCNKEIKHQDKCNGTTWVYSRSEASAVELIKLGKINNNVITKDKSNRLGLTADCSLVITNVTTEDVGHYSCRQYNKAGQQQGSDASVLLSVIDMEEQNGDDTVNLSCSVLRDNECEHTVEWLYEGNKNDVETSQSSCIATVTFKTPLHQKSKYYESLKCKVTDRQNRNTLLYNVCTKFSCEETAKSKGSTTVGTNNTPSANNDAPNKPAPEWWMWLIIGSVALVALLIITVAVIGWKRAKGNRTRMNESIGLSVNHAVTPPVPETSQDMADPEEGVSYASVSYTKKTNSKAQVRVKDDDDDDGDAVTYSTVKAPPSSSSSSAGASADLNNLYATVNKPKT